MNLQPVYRASENCSENDTVTVYVDWLEEPECMRVSVKGCRTAVWKRLVERLYPLKFHCSANIQTLMTDHARLRKVTRINDQKQL